MFLVVKSVLLQIIPSRYVTVARFYVPLFVFNALVNISLVMSLLHLFTSL